MSEGCTHLHTTVSVVWQNDLMTRRCDSCGKLFGPFYIYDAKKPWLKIGKKETTK